MYSNYVWPPQINPAFEVQQQQPFTIPLTQSSTINDNNQIFNQENESPPKSFFESSTEFPDKLLAEPFQLTATSEGITLDELKERIKIKLVEEKLFNKFKDVQLEMIITKAGRNLFPKLNFMVEGLEPDNCYLFSIMFKRVDNLKYKYTRSRWMENGPADDEYQQKEYPHPANTRFQNGQQWMETEISFATLKLTNSQQNSSKNAVVLRSMHKYCPVLIIYRFDPENSTFTKFIEKEITASTFMSVTAYQNSEVTKLKVDNNPFAKGFRDGGRKRVRCYQSDSESALSPPPVKQSIQQVQPNPLFSTPFFNTLNYIQNWYNPNITSNELLENYYAQAFQAQNATAMFNPQNFNVPTNYESPQ